MQSWGVWSSKYGNVADGRNLELLLQSLGCERLFSTVLIRGLDTVGVIFDVIFYYIVGVIFYVIFDDIADDVADDIADVMCCNVI